MSSSRTCRVWRSPAAGTSWRSQPCFLHSSSQRASHPHPRRRRTGYQQSVERFPARSCRLPCPSRLRQAESFPVLRCRTSTPRASGIPRVQMDTAGVAPRHRVLDAERPAPWERLTSVSATHQGRARTPRRRPLHKLCFPLAVTFHHSVTWMMTSLVLTDMTNRRLPVFVRTRTKLQSPVQVSTRTTAVSTRTLPVLRN